MGTVGGYPASKNAPMKRWKVNDGPVMPVVAPAVHVHWLAGVTRETISKVERDYWWYRSIIDKGADQPVDVSAKVIDDRDDVFAQEAL